MSINGKINKQFSSKVEKKVIDEPINIGKSLRFATLGVQLEDFLNNNAANLTREKITDFLAKKMKNVKFESDEEIKVFNKIILFLDYINEVVNKIYKESKTESKDELWENIFFKKCFNFEPKGEFIIEKTPFGVVFILFNKDDVKNAYGDVGCENLFGFIYTVKFKNFNFQIFVINGSRKEFLNKEWVEIRKKHKDTFIHEKQHLIFHIINMAQKSFLMEETAPNNLFLNIDVFKYKSDLLVKLIQSVNDEINKKMLLAKDEILACFKEGETGDEIYNNLSKNESYDYFSKLINKFLNKSEFMQISLYNREMFKEQMYKLKKEYLNFLRTAITSVESVIKYMPIKNPVEKLNTAIYFLMSIPFKRWPEVAVQFNDYLYNFKNK